MVARTGALRLHTARCMYRVTGQCVDSDLCTIGWAQIKRLSANRLRKCSMLNICNEGLQNADIIQWQWLIHMHIDWATSSILFVWLVLNVNYARVGYEKKSFRISSSPTVYGHQLRDSLRLTGYICILTNIGMLRLKRKDIFLNLCILHKIPRKVRLARKYVYIFHSESKLPKTVKYVVYVGWCM